MALPARTETQTGFQDRYQLRQKRQPRYQCGTCGLRNCVCVLAVNENREGQQNNDFVQHMVVQAEQTSPGVERTDNFPVVMVLQQTAVHGVAKAPCSQFKEWANDGKGIEFTLATVIPLFLPTQCSVRSILSQSRCK